MSDRQQYLIFQSTLIATILRQPAIKNKKTDIIAKGGENANQLHGNQIPKKDAVNENNENNESKEVPKILISSEMIHNSQLLLTPGILRKPTKAFSANLQPEAYHQTDTEFHQVVKDKAEADDKPPKVQKQLLYVDRTHSHQHQKISDINNSSKISKLKHKWKPFLHWRMISLMCISSIYGWNCNIFFVTVPAHVKNYDLMPEHTAQIFMITAIGSMVSRLLAAALGIYLPSILSCIYTAVS